MGWTEQTDQLSSRASHKSKEELSFLIVWLLCLGKKLTPEWGRRRGGTFITNANFTETSGVTLKTSNTETFHLLLPCVFLFPTVLMEQEGTRVFQPDGRTFLFTDKSEPAPSPGIFGHQGRVRPDLVLCELKVSAQQNQWSVLWSPGYREFICSECVCACGGVRVCWGWVMIPIHYLAAAWHQRCLR